MALQLITGGNGLPGSQTGQEIMDLINANFTELYAALHPGLYTAFVPTFTGFSTPPTVLTSRYIDFGKFCHYYIRCSVGSAASNATTSTQTIPFAAANTSLQFAYGTGYNNGANLTVPMLVATRVNSNIVDLYTSAGFGAWTAGGAAKKWDFSLVFEKA